MRENKGDGKGRYIFTIIALVAVAVMILAGNTSAEFGDSSVKLKAFMTSSSEISYDNIKNVEYTDAFERGTRAFGIGSFKIETGDFKNSEFGSYKLYSWKACDAVVLISTKDNKYYVTNGKTEEETRALYEQLLEKAGLLGVKQ